MGASAATAAQCGDCCRHKEGGQLNFDVRASGSSDLVLPELGRGALPESSPGGDEESELSDPRQEVEVEPLAALGGRRGAQGGSEAGGVLPPSQKSDAEEDTASARSAATGEDSLASTEIDAAETRALVEHFVRDLIKGTPITAVAANGDLVECSLSINPEITVFGLRRKCAKDARPRLIPLNEISKVCLGSQVGSDSILPLDDMCVAVYTEDGQLVGFRFEDEDSRLAFVKCLSLFLGDKKVSFKPRRRKAGSHLQTSTPATSAGLPGAEMDESSFGLEDPDNISVPDCQETLVPFEFEVDAQETSL